MTQLESALVCLDVVTRRTAPTSCPHAQPFGGAQATPKTEATARGRLCLQFVVFFCSDLELLLAGTGSLGPLAVALGVDLGSEGVLELDSDNVDEENPGSQKKTSGLAVEKSSAEEAHGGAVVHRSAGDVEGEAGDDAIHQDAKVVTKEGTGDTQAQCRGDDEDVAETEKRVGRIVDIGALEERVGGLVTEGTLVEEVAEETEGEDGGGQEVAGYLGIAAESASEELGAVLCGDCVRAMASLSSVRVGLLGWLVGFARTNLCGQRC